MLKPLILKKAYKNLSQGGLLSFTDNVIKRMSSRPEYQPYAADVAILAEQLVTYGEALSKAVNRGIDNVAQKEEIKASMIETLDRITDQLNLHHNGLETWGLNAGMEVRREKASITGDILPPANLQVFSRGIRGEVTLAFKVLESKRVLAHGAEYSADNGETWHNGSYGSGTTIKLKDLPSRQAVLFRVRSIGTFQRKSPWTEPVEGFVI
jgi:hypothetical protein